MSVSTKKPAGNSGKSGKGRRPQPAPKPPASTLRLIGLQVVAIAIAVYGYTVFDNRRVPFFLTAAVVATTIMQLARYKAAVTSLQRLVMIGLSGVAAVVMFLSITNAHIW